MCILQNTLQLIVKKKEKSNKDKLKPIVMGRPNINQLEKEIKEKKLEDKPEYNLVSCFNTLSYWSTWEFYMSLSI